MILIKIPFAEWRKYRTNSGGTAAFAGRTGGVAYSAVIASSRCWSEMNPRKRRRLMFALALVVAAGGATALMLTALQDNVLYFYSPSDVFAKHVEPGRSFRIGGLVEPKSLHRGNGADVTFVVTDGK